MSKYDERYKELSEKLDVANGKIVVNTVKGETKAPLKSMVQLTLLLDIFQHHLDTEDEDFVPEEDLGVDEEALMQFVQSVFSPEELKDSENEKPVAFLLGLTIGYQYCLDTHDVSADG